MTFCYAEGIHRLFIGLLYVVYRVRRDTIGGYLEAAEAMQLERSTTRRMQWTTILRYYR